VNEIAIDAKTTLGLFLPGGALGLVEGARVRIRGGAPGAVLEADSSIWWAEVAPDGARLLTISQDRSVIVWDLVTLRRGPSFAASSARFSRDGRTIVTVAVGGEVEVRDAVTGRLTMTAAGHHGRAWYALPCAGGQRVLSMGGDGSLRAWDAATGAQISAAPLKLNYVGFEVTDDCRFIAAMGDRRLATVLDASDGEPLNYIESRSGSTWLTIDPAGSRIAVVEGNRIVLWNLELANESPEVIESWTRCAIPFRVAGADFRPVGTDPGDCVSP
jgi:WD40 repeat protein